MVHIFETLDKKSGRNGWLMLGDGVVVLPENVNSELIHFLVQIVDHHYPLSVVKGICLDFPTFFVEIIKELMSHMSSWAKDRVSFINGSQLSEIMDQDQIPAYKLKSLTAPKP